MGKATGPRKNRPGYMLVGSPPRWKKRPEGGVLGERIPTPFTPVTMNGVQEAPSLPVVKIERGSGGDVRYSVSIPAFHPDTARVEALRQFQLIKEALNQAAGVS